MAVAAVTAAVTRVCLIVTVAVEKAVTAAVTDLREPVRQQRVQLLRGLHPRPLAAVLLPEYEEGGDAESATHEVQVREGHGGTHG